MRLGLILAVCMVVFSVSAAYAEFYRWVDREGKEFFTNEPQKIPQEYRTNAVKVTTDDSRVSVGDKPAVRGTKTSTAKEHKDKYGKGEEYWRKKASGLRMKLRDQQDDYGAVIKELNEQDQKPQDYRAAKKKKRTSLEKKKAKLEKDIARTRRRLEVDLPEEARRADAYPGWIRE
jgi:hypothetical protein